MQEHRVVDTALDAHEAQLRANLFAPHTNVEVLPDGRHCIEYIEGGRVRVRTFARDPKIAQALADILLEQGATPDCPHCEVIA